MLNLPKNYSFVPLYLGKEAKKFNAIFCNASHKSPQNNCYLRSKSQSKLFPYSNFTWHHFPSYFLHRKKINVHHTSQCRCPHVINIRNLYRTMQSASFSRKLIAIDHYSNESANSWKFYRNESQFSSSIQKSKGSKNTEHVEK